MGWETRVIHRGHPEERVIADIHDEEGIARLHIWGRIAVSRRWAPHESIADAWMIVEALKNRFRRVEVHCVGGEFHCMVAAGTSEVDEHYPFCREAQTAPEAICLAALAVLDSEG
jgi:hypothetical protein